MSHSKSKDDTSKLSERIASIAKKLLKQHFSKSHFPQLLLRTEDHECVKNILTEMWIRVSHMRDATYLLLESCVKKAETEEQKHIYNELILRTKLINQEKDDVFKIKFGALNDTHRSKLVPQETWLFTQYLTKHANNGTINELIVITFIIILFKCEARRTFIECSSNVKLPNFLSQFWFTNSLESFIPSFQQLIDSKQPQITADEEKHLIDVVKQTIAYAHVSIRLSWQHRNHVSRSIKLSE